MPVKACLFSGLLYVKRKYKTWFGPLQIASIGLLLVCSWCGRIEDEIFDKPMVTTNEVSELQATSATCSGNVIDDGGIKVKTRGVCYRENNGSWIFKPANEGGIGPYAVIVDGLSPNTDYYVKAYAINAIDTSYGEQKSFKTQKNKQSPIVTTLEVIEVYATGAVCSGTITDNGGSEIIERGICYRVSGGSEHCVPDDASGAGTIRVTIGGLSPYKTYFFKAYARNSVTTAFGIERSFRTKAEEPILYTYIQEEYLFSAKLKGHIIYNGGAEIVKRGICYSDHIRIPDINNGLIKTDINVGEGAYLLDLKNLKPNTKYYARAFAINEAQVTGYGDRKTFITRQDIIPDGLVAYYPFEGNANDMTGHGHHGKKVSVSPTTGHDGKSNSAYLFNGNSMIDIDDHSDLDITGALSVSLWYKYDNNTTAWGRLISKPWDEIGVPPWVVYSMTIGPHEPTYPFVYFETYDEPISAGNPYRTSFAGFRQKDFTFQRDEWYHLCGVFDPGSSKIYLYINGTTVQDTTINNTSILTTETNLQIGNDQNSGKDNGVKGAIDNVRIYNRALSPAEVNQLYNE